MSAEGGGGEILAAIVLEQRCVALEREVSRLTADLDEANTLIAKMGHASCSYAALHPENFLRLIPQKDEPKTWPGHTGEAG